MSHPAPESHPVSLCKRAGIFEERVMGTKPVLAAEMIERALDAGIETDWTTGDAVYGQHTGLRRRLEARGMHYVMAVPMNQRAITPTPDSLCAEGRVDQLFADLDKMFWRTRTRLVCPRSPAAGWA
nr:transposase [Cryobacterium sp. Y50]